MPGEKGSVLTAQKRPPPPPKARPMSLTTSTSDVAADARPPGPSARELFTGFLSIGLMGFGGVLPLARRVMVEKRGWLTAAEFTDMLGLCQFLPGGNIINMAVALGLKFRGALGAFAAVTGLIAAPSLIIIALGILYGHYQDEPHLQRLFAGLSAAAAGLLVAMSIRMLLPMLKRPVALLVILAGFTAVALLRLPLLPTLLVLMPVSVFLSWRRWL